MYSEALREVVGGADSEAFHTAHGAVLREVLSKVLSEMPSEVHCV